MSKLEDLVVPHTAQAVVFGDLDPALSPQGAQLLAQRFDLIGNLKVKVEAFLGNAELSVSELFALKEQTVVPLEASPSDSIDLMLDGKLIGRGTLVVVGEKFGIRLTEVAK